MGEISWQQASVQTPQEQQSVAVIAISGFCVTAALFAARIILCGSRG